ncbi:hypothetical protein [Microbacterium dextranolyticum]|uniref:Uncharacterized protein n=1 Tax=Microbacterium dextranolyticum TaxID=36806 RepID=A0A9W6HM42_9MICO|nr:hypothetical protein [Microbacterium dextranolyticum]MBM7463187.1 hypothetical protein [Microbacterium dextranolyticum]GLJ95707.1 hypothetical protein GCM10017591_17700 [Microbacterium dextranolyticum]
MNSPVPFLRRHALALGAGALLIATLGVGIASLTVATSTASDADAAARSLSAQVSREADTFGNEVVQSRTRTIIESDGSGSALLIEPRYAFIPLDYATVSITFERADGSPVEGKFEAKGQDGGLALIATGVSPGTYRVVVEQLRPSEIDHPLVFTVEVHRAD